MSRQHGKDTRVYLDGRDASGDLTQIEPTIAADMHDVTTFGQEWKVGDPGLLGWELAYTGFYDPAAAGFTLQMDALIGGPIKALSIFTSDADAIGDTGLLFGPGILKEQGEPMTVADMVKETGSIQGVGRVGAYGKLLRVLAQDTVSTNGASLNNTGSSANGGRGNLHVTAVTGTWTIKIEESADNSNWNTLITFTAVAAAGGPTGESKEVTGAVKQYLRVTSTEDVAGSITFAVGFARY